MIKSKKTETLIGKTVYYTQPGYSGGICSGVIVKLTPEFCVMENNKGEKKRKAKHLVFETEDDVKIDVIKKVNDYLFTLDMTILELGVIFKEMLEKYPEKFV